MKRLVVFGDSVTVGYVDALGFGNYIKSFPEYLSECVGCSLLNRGHTGHSNTAILSDFLYYLEYEHQKNDMVLMVWSSENRSTVYNPSVEKRNFRESYFLHRFCGENWDRPPWKLYTDDCDDAFEDFHMKRVLSISAYNTVKRLCEKENIPYRMTSGFSDKWLLDNISIIDKTDVVEKGFPILDVTKHQRRPIVDKDDPNWIERNRTHNTIMDIPFGKWKSNEKRTSDYFYHKSIFRENDFTDLYYKCGHPTEKGNKLIAETLAPYIREMMT